MRSCLQQTAYIFKGNAEVRDVPNGDFDVVVADGFVGNVILKTIEGVPASSWACSRTACAPLAAPAPAR